MSKISDLSQKSEALELIDNRGETNPYVNLALEEYVTRNMKSGNYLLFYRNEPSVVLGKHQGIAEEVNFSASRDGALKIARRISGGGAVYHDPGNLNVALFTDHTPERHNQYAHLLGPVIATLSRHGIPARINRRNSLVLATGEKISGCAQFVSRGRMLSHGTLLYDAQLDSLRRSLRPDLTVLRSRGVPSVRSSVRNIAPLLPPSLSLAELQSELTQAFASTVVRRPLLPQEWREVRALAEQKYATWEWIVGRSPKFTLQGGHDLQGEVTVHDGWIEQNGERVTRFAPWIGSYPSLGEESP